MWIRKFSYSFENPPCYDIIYRQCIIKKGPNKPNTKDTIAASVNQFREQVTDLPTNARYAVFQGKNKIRENINKAGFSLNNRESVLKILPKRKPKINMAILPPIPKFI